MISLKDVSFTYDSQEKKAMDENNPGTVSNMNLEFKKGDFVVITGESGCGKSTVNRLINGLAPNFYQGTRKGTVTIWGQDPKQCEIYETARIVGSVFQNPRTQFFNVDTTSEVAFACENQGLEKEEIKNRVKRTVQSFHIEKLMNRSIFQLSGGEKQKIACACVATANTPVVVLDEPSSNLDINAIEDLRSISMEAVFKQKVQEKKEECKDALMIKKLVFSYKDSHQGVYIENVSFGKGRITAVVGHNGAGKSTLAKEVCGILPKCKSEIYFDGKKIKNKELVKKGFLVMQDVNTQLFSDSVKNEILLSLQDKFGKKGSREEMDREAMEILKAMDIDQLEERHPISLSGGQKQRVAIASALAADKEILIFNEPTSGLDLKHMKEVSGALTKLSEMGKVVIVITHDPELILSTADDVLFLGLDILVAGKATGILLITVFSVCRITRMFLPVYMVFMLMMKTTRVSEFIAAFDRMHFPDEITIPFSVMFRFFPMMWEEWENIQNAMKFRGLSFSVKNIFTRPMQVYECAMVPLLADAVMIADELSAASLSRGLGADTKRTCITEVKIGFVDVVVMIIAIGLNICSAFAF